MTSLLNFTGQNGCVNLAGKTLGRKVPLFNAGEDNKTDALTSLRLEAECLESHLKHIINNGENDENK